ncbi:6-phosphofructokinase [Leptolyngbya sp. 7M]|uniref:6-phosphofructokinase n=1 Tax=Leptolyngbya sp. 7M TaxID=2812896 RepID=UPI001B8B212B|nr:6-phosphofructokinase [Leptolyngbya sp. 7M]QYO64662.1 6-phosphofructokinase [Leptolyngbya sp. 7M]
MGAYKRIGILTSGGDCAGLNAVIRAVVHRASTYNWDVWGIQQATKGLMARPPQVVCLEPTEVDTLLTMGGTILGTTNKGNPFAYPMSDGSLSDRSNEIIEGYHLLGLDAMGTDHPAALAAVPPDANCEHEHSSPSPAMPSRPAAGSLRPELQSWGTEPTSVRSRESRFLPGSAGA